MRRTSLVRAAATVAVVLGIVASPGLKTSVALANPSCTSATDLWDGGDGPSHTSFYATRVWLTTQPIGMCASNSDTWSDTSAWSMMGGGSSNGLQYAQSGYLQSVAEYLANKVPSSTTTYYFSAYNNGWQNEVFKAFSQAGYYQNHEYWQKYVRSSGVIQIYGDTTLLDSTSFDPTLVWTSPWNSEFAGETHDSADYMPGTTATWANFTYPGEATSLDTSGDPVWYNLTQSQMSGHWFTSTTNYKQSYLNPAPDPSFGIWDSRH